MAHDDKEFDPSEKGALRVLHGPRWLLESDFAQPTLDMLQSGRNLRQFESEVAPNYDFRKYMSCPLDMIPDGIGIRVDNIFREPPEREIDESPFKAILQTLVNDADNQGTPLDLFMQRVLWNHEATGIDIITQMTAAPEEMTVETQQDVLDAALRPFFMQFNPLQKVDWATTGANKYKWLRVSLGEEPAATEEAGASGITRYLSLTATTWTLWGVKTNDQGDKDSKAEKLGEGEHDLGIVPAIKFYVSESMTPGEGGVPMSLITRAAVIARCALNLKSQADMDLLAAVARWMMTGLGSDKAPDSIGPMELWATENADADLKAVQASTDPVREKREWMVLYLSEILRLLKFRGGMGDTEGNQGSGVKLALEMTDLRNELTKTANSMEALELEMMRQAVVMATGTDIPREDAADVLKYSVKYNKQFVLDSAEELLDQMERWFVKLEPISSMLPTTGEALLRRFGNLWIRNDDAASETAKEEIEAAVGQIETVEPEDAPEEKVGDE